jgi:hypothetical protein
MEFVHWTEGDIKHVFHLLLLVRVLVELSHYVTLVAGIVGLHWVVHGTNDCVVFTTRVAYFLGHLNCTLAVCDCTR